MTEHTKTSTHRPLAGATKDITNALAVSLVVLLGTIALQTTADHIPTATRILLTLLIAMTTTVATVAIVILLWRNGQARRDDQQSRSAQ